MSARSCTVLLPRCGIELRTPALMLHTKGASVPHITREVFDIVTKASEGTAQETFAYEVPLLTTHQMKVGAKLQGEGVAKFAGLGEAPIYMTFHDPAVAVPQCPMEKFTVPLWTRMGKFLYDADLYMDAVETFKPDIYELLSDAVTNAKSSKKRIRKSIERSKEIISRCLERHRSSKYLKDNALVFAPIGGGFSKEERQSSIDNILASANDIDGFVLDGLFLDDFETVSYEDMKDTVEFVTKQLPADKYRSARGPWNALTTLDLVLAGWDLFDTSMPLLVTERGCALIFSYRLHEDPDHSDENQYEVNLNEDRYKDDFTAIKKDCECLTCKNHTKAYVNHLLKTKELLANVLLMIHNLHHYTEFFRIIRESVSSNNVHTLREKVAKQYAKHKIAPKIQVESEANKKARIL